MSIGFVIVTYNSERVLAACLKSIPQGHDVAVIDNASKDSSPQIAKSFGARVLVNCKNLGFGTACNQGAKLLTTSHVFFLNPDAVLAGDAIRELEKAMELYPDAGGFGPAIQVQGKRQKFRTTSYIKNRGARYTDEFPPSEIADVDFLDGAAVVCNRELFLELGGFDERIFLYFDDDDLCFRIRSHGRRLLYVPQARVFHERNASSGESFRLVYLRSFHAARSKILISNKYGMPIDVRHEKRRAVLLFFRSIAMLNVRKAASLWGTFSGLR